MEADVGTESVSAGAGLGAGGDFGVDLIADLAANRGGVGEVGVVAADVERDGEVEERFAGFESDGRAAGFGLSDAGRGFGGGLFGDGCVGIAFRTAAGGA